jgi:hypothetical protein
MGNGITEPRRKKFKKIGGGSHHLLQLLLLEACLFVVLFFDQLFGEGSTIVCYSGGQWKKGGKRKKPVA